MFGGGQFGPIKVLSAQILWPSSCTSGNVSYGCCHESTCT